MRQFLLTLPGPDPAVVGDALTLDPDESRHIKTVLRTEADQILELTDGRGFRYAGRLVSERGAPPAVEIISRHQDRTEGRPPQLVLALAVVKGKRFDWALEKACELGAHVIIPLQTEYGVIEPSGGKQQRWKAILKSALKQSGRCLLPRLTEFRTLAETLQQTAGPVWYGASPGAERERGNHGSVPVTATRLGGVTPGELMVCIGPEGGWSSTELDLLTAAGAGPLDLGPHVLRTETAAAAALVVLQQRRQTLLRDTGES